MRYLKLAHQYLLKRETDESQLVCEHVPDLINRFPAWMVSLSEWKESKGVRQITPYQAKRFARWLLAGASE